MLDRQLPWYHVCFESCSDHPQWASIVTFIAGDDCLVSQRVCVVGCGRDPLDNSWNIEIQFIYNSFNGGLWWLSLKLIDHFQYISVILWFRYQTRYHQKFNVVSPPIRWSERRPGTKNCRVLMVTGDSLSQLVDINRGRNFSTERTKIVRWYYYESRVINIFNLGWSIMDKNFWFQIILLLLSIGKILNFLILKYYNKKSISQGFSLTTIVSQWMYYCKNSLKSL